MVPRCGYYVDNGILVCETVYIEWNKGFDRDAKKQYCMDLLEALKHVGPVAEVTTASPFIETKSLSPYFINMKGEVGITVEDYIHSLHSNFPYTKTLPELFHMCYLQSLSEKHINTLHKFNCFTDVFDNPTKGFGHSQACSIALYKLLELENKLHLLGDNQAFLDWYRSEVKIRCITAGGLQ